MTTFVDTSYFLALALKNDSLHLAALAWKQALSGTLLTSEFVLLEVADDLSTPSTRLMAAAIISLVRQDSQFTVVPLDTKLFAQGMRLFDERRDKEWGLTDCISFEIMRERGIQDALTYDHHFEQAGFRALLRRDPSSN